MSVCAYDIHNYTYIYIHIQLYIIIHTHMQQLLKFLFIFAVGKQKENHVQNKEKSVSGGKRNSKFRQGSKVEHTSVEPILRYPIEVFVSCGENFSKPESELQFLIKLLVEFK